jgi:hypothetical protein
MLIDQVKWRRRFAESILDEASRERRIATLDYFIHAAAVLREQSISLIRAE